MSLLTALVKPQATSPAKAIARSSITACAGSFKDDVYTQNTQRRTVHRSATRWAGNGTASVEEGLEKIFIRSLVLAGSCRRHQPWASHVPGGRRRVHDLSHRSKTPAADRPARGFSTRTNEQHTAAAAAPSTDPEISKLEYEELVNTYPDFGQPLKQRKTKHERPPLAHLSLAPRLVLTPNQELRPQHGNRVVLAAEDESHQRSIDELQRLLRGRLGRVSQSKLWHAWEGLRTPRPRYLDDETLQRLFRHLTWVEHKHAPEAMQRFLAVMNECTSEQLPVKSQVWNTAISFTGRWIRGVSSQEVKNAVEMWMRMEEADVRADAVTFNILFDIALKAGRFALADTIFAELSARSLAPDRYTRAGLIYYAGVRRDGDAVRHAFQAFVAADEIVDTAIMNSVIAALLRAGEAPAAESVFHKMKALHARKFGAAAPASWQAQRELGTLLKRAGAHLRRDRRRHEASFFGGPFSTASRRDDLQHASPIAPDAATYRLLLQHHAYVSADVARAAELLAEMRERALHVHGSVYYHLFRGYRLHGGFAFSAWTLKGLETLWSELLAAIAGKVPSTPSVPTTSMKELEPVATEDGDPGPRDHDDDVHAPTPPNEDLSPGETTEREPSHPEMMSFDDDAPDDDEGVRSELERRPYFSTGLAVAVLRAFHHCAGRERMLEVWAEMLAGWKGVSGEERARVQEVVDRFGEQRRVFR